MEGSKSTVSDQGNSDENMETSCLYVPSTARLRSLALASTDEGVDGVDGSGAAVTAEGDVESAGESDSFLPGDEEEEEEELEPLLLLLLEYRRAVFSNNCNDSFASAAYASRTSSRSFRCSPIERQPCFSKWLNFCSSWSRAEAKRIWILCEGLLQRWRSICHVSAWRCAWRARSRARSVEGVERPPVYCTVLIRSSIDFCFTIFFCWNLVCVCEKCVFFFGFDK